MNNVTDTLPPRAQPSATIPPIQKRSPRPSRRGWAMNLMYLPAAALLVVFVFVPLIQGIGLAFTNWDGYSPTRAFVGIANFAQLFTDATFHTALLNTLLFGFGCTLLQQVLGLALAVALDGRGRMPAVARSIVYLPVLVSPVVMGLMYYLVFQYNRGALNDVVGGFGVGPIAWLSSGPGAITIIILVNTLQFVGISMVIYLAGLQGISPDVYEAASLDGASGWALLRSITIPLLQPAFVSSVIINLIGGLKLFDVIQVLTGGGPGYASNSVSTLIGRTYFGQQAAGYASAMGVALFVIIAIVSVFLVRRMSRTDVTA